MITFRISQKLFASFFFILITVAAALFLSRYIFSMNFEDYIRQVEMEKLEKLAPVLQEEYQRHDSWTGVRDYPDYWVKLLDDRSDIRRNRVSSQEEEQNRQTSSRVLMLDAELRPLLGTVEEGDQPQLVPVTLGDTTVGWLGLKKRSRFGPPAAFLERQARHLTLLGLAVVALTALIAFLFSRHLLQPIQRLANGTQELANRNFTVRIPPMRKDELGRLAENFNDMAQTLETYEKQRRQWLSDISHELRTPLAVLRGEIEALQDGIRKPSPENLTSLHMEILRISKLVEDLHVLSLTESDSIALHYQQMRAVTALRNSLVSFRTRLKQSGIETELDLDDIEQVEIRGDSTRLGQVFVNILENVCRYVESPAMLKVSGSVDNAMLCLFWEDSGPGVPEEALPRLFDRLYRVDSSRNRDSGGSGLGLSICRHIIEHHNGTIHCEKSALGGLKIVIKLPVSAKRER
jgi:two-component system, OmpR family, sensor histidine kinase BaeS